MNEQDAFNLMLLNASESIDQINSKFYGRFNYPWPPAIIPNYPPGIAETYINQDIGYWSHDRIPQRPRIWVAGCGANQALITALKFPNAEVLGTDISKESLKVCRRNADQIGVTNLELEEKSLNGVDYREAFDYVICTGVVHHNAAPALTLGKISAALKRDGVMEFMVYNYYHRLMTTACQKAIKNFYDVGRAVDLDLELSLIKSLMKGFKYNNLMGEYLQSYTDSPEAEMADMLLQPLEHSYTIETMEQLISSCNLEYLLHCQNQFDKSNTALSWNLSLENDRLQQQYNSLPDVKRWQITNLLLLNESPMLWFYLKRKDAGWKRKTEQEVCDEFLETTFIRSSFQMSNYVLDARGHYTLSDKVLTYPILHNLQDSIAKKIWQEISPGGIKMKDAFFRAGIKPTFQQVNNTRIKLSTFVFPYLLAKC